MRFNIDAFSHAIWVNWIPFRKKIRPKVFLFLIPHYKIENFASLVRAAL